ncbi:hypothetical protein PCC7418_3779 [Halothece sp. PCC 7418]|uniref:hypothetical protein n=1 Tax=Halothece sp. (strain PCC 7418) TaxID=65093 RepID=UPI0002A06000|nr:hypothetical protein [Halothece sp. PCC 7418]AFZ45883.1 hypothetical protein PCC7418_3779 [Halothece sp. PCC 7418]
MVLPEALQQEFNRQVKQATEETQMPLLSHLELEAKEEGRKEGRKEEKQAVALNFLRMGLSPQQVAQGTGLSLEEVQELQTQLEAES